MLDLTEIQKALGASRVVDLGAGHFHGPLGLEELAAMVATIPNSPLENLGARIGRPVALLPSTWAKLDELAENQTKQRDKPISACEVVAGIVENFVAHVSS